MKREEIYKRFQEITEDMFSEKHWDEATKIIDDMVDHIESLEQQNTALQLSNSNLSKILDEATYSLRCEELKVKQLEKERANMQATHQSTISQLQARIKDLEEKDKIGFQALNCSQCQGGGCPVCGGSGFVFGKNLYKYHTEDRICGNCKFAQQTVYDGVIICTIGAHIFGRKAQMERVEYFCADFAQKDTL